MGVTSMIQTSWPVLTKEALFLALSEGTTILTPNNRLSQELLEDYFHNTKKTVYAKPRCFPYQTFLVERYTKARQMYAHQTHPLLLTNTQQHHLWRQILLKQSPYSYHDGLLQEIKEAWTRCQQWNIKLQNIAFQQTPQTQQFQRWWQQFEKKLNEIHAITTEQLPTHLLHYPDLFSASPIVWACFDDFTPIQQRLQQEMNEQGSPQYVYDLDDIPHRSSVYAAEDDEDEWLQMIEWLKQALLHENARIGIVVPDLETQCRPIKRLLQRHIPSHAFNITLGHALIDFSLVTHGLTWLNLDLSLLNHHQACLLLHSPYLAGSKSEFIARADMMQNNPLLKEPQLSLDALKISLINTTPILAACLMSLPHYPEEAPVSTWAQLFKARLTHFGFPGEYPLDSENYQCFQRFVLLFDEFLQLSVITPILKKEDALSALTILAQSTIFQSKTNKTSIQILGLLEASGCHFDNLWITGLTHQCLPKKCRLSAFIPIELQRSLNMPHAVPQRELKFAEQCLKRLQRGSHESILSYSRLSGDSPNLPSPLLSNLPSWTALPKMTPSHSSFLNIHEEDYQLPFLPHESVSGGTSLLANQAKCPFKAFAMHRLSATSAPSLSEGLDASERGQILHKIMELFWKKVGSQAQLLSLSPIELNQLIDTMIEIAMTTLIPKHRLSFSSLVQEVERLRLNRLVHEYLTWEKMRPPFIIEALEQEFSMTLAGIEFRVRIDRLDKTQDETKWVIDYKSSLPTSKPWNEERPEAPQLLLYALLDHQIHTLLLIQLKSGQIVCSGISNDDLTIDGMSGLKKGEDWSEKQSQWREQLTLLAQEIQEGHCPPLPTKESHCLQCDFLYLCRKKI